MWAQTHDPAELVWTPRHAVVPAATRVDLSHLGIHTHADLLLFRISGTDVAALRADPHVRNVRIVAHCRLPTNDAALPPGFGWLSPGASAIPTYGPIDGHPGWSLSVVPGSHGHSNVRVSVPSRFANWVAGQPPALQKKYESRKSYSLEIDWEQQG